MAETLKQIVYQGFPVIVEAAKRDQDGNLLDTTYAKKADIYTKEDVDKLIQETKDSIPENTPEQQEIDVTVKFVEVINLPETPEKNTFYIMDNCLYVYGSDSKWKQCGISGLKTINNKSLVGTGNIAIDTFETSNISTGVLPLIGDCSTSKLYQVPVFGDVDQSVVAYYDYYVILNDTWVKISSTMINEEYIDKKIASAQLSDASGGTSVNLDEYAKKSDLTIFLKSTDIPTKISAFENDKKYVTAADVPSLRVIKSVENVDIDDCLNTGDYSVTSAINAPISDKGILKVDNYVTDQIDQTWETASAISKRKIIFDSSNMDFKNSLHISGTVYGEWDATANNTTGGWKTSSTFDKTYITGEEIVLQAGGEYTISGTYNGKISIKDQNYNTDGGAYSFSANTVLHLNGVKLRGDSSLITYAPTEEKLIICLENGTYNYLIDADSTSATLISAGVIHSENNLVISGYGGLSILSTSGRHGIKGSEVVVGGNPSLYISAKHDGIHASKYINIQNGIVSVLEANDGFEAENSSSTKGVVHITGGTVSISNCTSSAINAAVSGVICGSSTKVKISNTVNGISDKIKILPDATVSGVSYTLTDFEEYFGTPSITIAEETSEDVYTAVADGDIELAGGMYTISEQIAIVSGYIFAPIQTTLEKCKIVLRNAYIVNEQNQPTIYATSDSANLTIVSEEETINYVEQMYGISVTGDNDAIKSEGDIRCSGDGVLFTYSNKGDGIDGSKVEFKGNGPRYALDCGGCGIKATALYLGGDATASSKKCVSNIYALGNNKENNYSTVSYFPGADIYCRNGKCKKGVYLVYAGYFGITCTNTFKSLNISYTRESSITVLTAAYKNAIYYTIENTGLTKYYADKGVNVVDNTDLIGAVKAIGLSQASLETIKTKVIGAWATYYSLPEIPTETDTNFVLTCKNGTLSWSQNISATVDEIPANAILDESGNQIVDSDNNTLIGE